ncbi:MAG: hypothetical protein L0212_12360, partial [Acidobacteria bacterium]|nr:hypothetical protein [Acidobacteriota bacterium]
TEFAGVAEVLKPVLGEVSGGAPDALKPLEQALEVLRWCRSLSDVLQNGVLEHGRCIKAAIGERYFEPQALVEFVRFNFSLRRAFFRLLQTDLHSVRRTLDELEKKGHAIVDCSQAGLSAEESLAALRQKCLEWKKPFQASYSAGPLPFEEIVAVRAALDHALTLPPTEPIQACVETQFIASPAALASQVVQVQHSAPAPQPVVAQPIVVYPVSAPLPSPIIKPPVVPAAPVAARQEVAAKPATAATPAPPPQPAPKVAPKAADVQSCLESIAEQLFAGAGKAAVAATTVIVGGAKVALSSWEVEAFVRGGDEVCDTLQRSVAARALLSEAVESRKRGEDSGGLPSTISLAQTEAASVQLQMETARKARNLEAAVNLAATAKRLLALITEAQSLAAVPAMEMSR